MAAGDGVTGSRRRADDKPFEGAADRQIQTDDGSQAPAHQPLDGHANRRSARRRANRESDSVAQPRTRLREGEPGADAEAADGTGASTHEDQHRDDGKRRRVVGGHAREGGRRRYQLPRLPAPPRHTPASRRS